MITDSDKFCKFGVEFQNLDDKMAFKGIIEVDTQRCKGCSVCVANCPTGSIRLSSKVNGKGYNYAEMVGDGCIGCSNCAIVCPDSVITVYRAKVQ